MDKCLIHIKKEVSIFPFSHSKVIQIFNHPIYVGWWWWRMPLATRLKTFMGERILGKVIICAPREGEVQFTCCAVLSCFSCVWLCATLWTIAHQAPLSMGFSRQEYWSMLTCPPLLHRIFPTQGSNLCLLHWQMGSLPSSATWEAWFSTCNLLTTARTQTCGESARN